MSTNPRLNDLKTLYQTFYKNYTYELGTPPATPQLGEIYKHNVLWYLNNIAVANTNTNPFDTIVKRILSLNISQTANIWTVSSAKISATETKTNYNYINEFEKIFTTIYLVAKQLNDGILANADYSSYNDKSTVIIENVSGTSTSTVTTELKVNNPYKTAAYATKGIIRIYANGKPDIIPITFNKNSSVYKNKSDITEIEIVNNYLRYLMSFESQNFTLQVKTFYNFMELLKRCAIFVYHSELFIANGSAAASNRVCGYFATTFAQDMLTFKNDLYNLSLSDNATSQTIKLYIEDDQKCPLKLTGEKLAGQSYGSFSFKGDIENYYVEIDNKRIDIIGAEYDESSKDKIKSITLNAYTSCSDNMANIYQVAVTKEPPYNVTFKRKTVRDFKNEYFDIGQSLSKLNLNIDKSKADINASSVNYNKQNDSLKYLNIKLYVYYVVFGIALIAYIVISLMNVNSSKKIIASLIILCVILIINIINYFTNKTDIEHFTTNGVTVYTNENYTGTSKTLGVGDYNIGQMGVPNDSISSVRVPTGYTVTLYWHANFSGTALTLTNDTPKLKEARDTGGRIVNFDNVTSSIRVRSVAIVAEPTTCEAMTAQNSSVARRVNFVNNNVTIMTTYVLDVLQAMMLYLASFESIDIVKKLSNSMKDEERTFKTYENVYQFKADSSKKTIEVLKRSIINKNAFTNMLSIAILIIGAAFSLYNYKSKYIWIYIIIAIILLFINMYIFYMAVLYPVRTKAKHKYWQKPKMTNI